MKNTSKLNPSKSRRDKSPKFGSNTIDNQTKNNNNKIINYINTKLFELCCLLRS
jgi:hypothetical protein